LAGIKVVDSREAEMETSYSQEISPLGLEMPLTKTERVVDLEKKVSNIGLVLKLAGSAIVLVALPLFGYICIQLNQQGRQLAAIDAIVRKQLPTMAESLIMAPVGSEAQLRRNLSVSATLVQSAREEKRKSDSASVTKVGQELVGVLDAHPVVSEGWQAAAELVSYRSDLRTGFQSKKLRDCFDDQGSQDVEFTNPNYWTGIHDVLMTKCSLDISNVDGFWKSRFGLGLTKLESTVGHPVPFRIFLNEVTLVYRGGDVIPAFYIGCSNCIYDFQIQNQIPSTRGKYLTRELLVADLANPVVTFPSGL
jgi:hypothetical protein